VTSLKDATKVYKGSSLASAVYAGSNKAWPTGFNPSTIAGLEIWLDPSQISLSDGAAVTTWPNLGSGAVPSIVGTPAPVFKTGILNALPVIRMTANEGRLRGTCTMNQNYTLLYVVRMWGASGNRAFSGRYPEGGNYLVGYHTFYMDKMFDNGIFLDAFQTAATSAWRLYSVDGSNPGSGYTVRFFINGVASGTASPTSSGLATYYCLSGYAWTTTEETGNFDFAELLIYDHKLSDAERIQVEGYLRGKWGLP
jgi:hypothetical protein